MRTGGGDAERPAMRLSALSTGSGVVGGAGDKAADLMTALCLFSSLPKAWRDLACFRVLASPLPGPSPPAGMAWALGDALLLPACIGHTWVGRRTSRLSDLEPVGGQRQCLQDPGGVGSGAI